jgi:hypothetical protein
VYELITGEPFKAWLDRTRSGAVQERPGEHSEEDSDEHPRSERQAGARDAHGAT